MPEPKAQGFLAEWPWWLPPALLSLALSLYFIDPFIGDWDALDYTVLAINGKPSTLLLGRSLFIFYNRALWLITHALFNLPPEKAYLLFKYAVVVQSPLAVIVWWRVARELSKAKEAATVAALLLATSSFYILYSGQVMTEIPSILLLGVSLLVHLRGLRRRSFWLVLAGAALMGLSVNLREATGLYGVWLALSPFVYGWKPGRRELMTTALACAVFFLFAFGGFGFFYLLNVGNYRHDWEASFHALREESKRHPVQFKNMGPLMWYFLLAAPVVLVSFPFAAWREWKRRGLTPLLLLGLIGLLANLSLIVHYSVVLNGRYLLTGLPAMVPLVGSYLMESQAALLGNRRRAFISVTLGVLLATALFSSYYWPGNYSYALSRARSKDYRERLVLLPKDGVVIAGGQTVGVTYWRGIGLGDWDAIGTGAGWPGARLPAEIERYLNDGRRVFIDTDPRWWTPCGWQLAEIRQLTEMEKQFRFRRVSDTIFEIRPVDDQSAQDSPHLEKLLPESRPEDAKYCSG
ncbi:MAG TPA: glycosyltransferase family 39 protein [Pyrinomonadaceae bacterium]|nr:glycosyltransferase family 39 protein [Pyrinomonadaceae bacterium]